MSTSTPTAITAEPIQRLQDLIIQPDPIKRVPVLPMPIRLNEELIIRV
jgi:hypothetical protein